MELGKAALMARELMDHHGLGHWGFEFDRARVRAGACHHRDRRITLSRGLTAIHDEDRVRDTLLHEIAHALVGPRHGHDEVWRRRALVIGSSGQRCYLVDEPELPGRWQGRCLGGHVVHRHRRPTRVLLCGRCPRDVPELDRVLVWAHDGVPVASEQLGPEVERVMQMLHRRAAGDLSDRMTFR